MNRRTFLERLGILGIAVALPFPKTKKKQEVLTYECSQDSIEKVYIDGKEVLDFRACPDGYVRLEFQGKPLYIYVQKKEIKNESKNNYGSIGVFNRRSGFFEKPA